jgi:hypothetical protein
MNPRNPEVNSTETNGAIPKEAMLNNAVREVIVQYSSVVERRKAGLLGELYDSPHNINLSAITDNYVLVPSIWVPVRIGPK